MVCRNQKKNLSVRAKISVLDMYSDSEPWRTRESVNPIYITVT